LHTAPDDYNPVLPYRALATILFDAGDYRSALDLLTRARQIDSSSSSANMLDRDIRTLESMLPN
jgi:hypothetical protein